MVDIESVFERLKHFFKVISDIDLAEKLGLTPTNFAGYKKRKTIPYEHIFNALSNSDVDLQYIFYGIESKTYQPQTSFIQYYSDISSSDGNGNINFAGKYEMIQIDAGLFPDVDIKHAMAIRINSTSMATTFMRDDTVLIDKSRTDIDNGKVYIIEINGYVSIVRIYVIASGYVISYDNKNYPRDEYTADQFRVIGQVKYKLEYVG